MYEERSDCFCCATECATNLWFIDLTAVRHRYWTALGQWIVMTGFPEVGRGHLLYTLHHNSDLLKKCEVTNEKKTAGTPKLHLITGFSRLWTTERRWRPWTGVELESALERGSSTGRVPARDLRVRNWPPKCIDDGHLKVQRSDNGIGVIWGFYLLEVEEFARLLDGSINGPSGVENEWASMGSGCVRFSVQIGFQHTRWNHVERWNLYCKDQVVQNEHKQELIVRFGKLAKFHLKRNIFINRKIPGLGKCKFYSKCSLQNFQKKSKK